MEEDLSLSKNSLNQSADQIELAKRQLALLEDQLRLNEEANRTAARAASAAEGSARVAEEALVKTSRAYVNYIRTEYSKDPGTIGPTSYKTFVANSGQTAATQLEFRSIIRYGPGDPLATPDTSESLLPKADGSATLSAQSTLTLGGSKDVVLPEQVVSMLSEGRAYFYYFGTLTYQDIFRRSHKTRFCVEYDYRRKEGNRMVFCTEHNDAD